METRRNDLGQPIGDALADWRGATPPVHERIEGTRCRLEPLSADTHAAALHAAYLEDRDGAGWTYLPYGPFDSAEAYAEAVRGFESLGHTLFYAIVDRASGEPVGAASYLRIDPALGSIEVGHLRYAPVLQRTPTSTEAMYLMMRRAFEDWGYRRYEWKCDSLNAPSRAAARRLGFRYEGTFRQATIVRVVLCTRCWAKMSSTNRKPLAMATVNSTTPTNSSSNSMVSINCRGGRICTIPRV